MYDFIKGELVDSDFESIVIENGGIGYKVYSSLHSISEFSNAQGSIIVYTKLIVKEDDMSLTGFSTRDELKMFKLLTSVSGVGTKAALSLLSSSSYLDLANAIRCGGHKDLTSAPGIGKKTAELIILKLRDKVDKEFPITLFNHHEITEIQPVTTETVDDSILALLSLGYTKTEVQKAMNKINLVGKSTEDIIKEGLSILIKG